MARKAKKTKTIGSTAKRLAKNFGRLAVEVQRIALMEMVKVYEKATTKSAKQAPKKKAVKRAKKRKGA